MDDLKEILELAIALGETWSWQAVIFGAVCLLVFRLNYLRRAIADLSNALSHLWERHRQKRCDHFFEFPGGWFGLDKKFYLPNPPKIARCVKCGVQWPQMTALEWEILKGRDVSDPGRSLYKSLSP